MWRQRSRPRNSVLRQWYKRLNYIQRGHTGTAEEVKRDEWSVYLHDDQDADVVLDMHTKTCTLSKDDNVRSYSVLKAADADVYSEADDTDE